PNFQQHRRIRNRDSNGDQGSLRHTYLSGPSAVFPRQLGAQSFPRQSFLGYLVDGLVLAPTLWQFLGQLLPVGHYCHSTVQTSLSWSKFLHRRYSSYRSHLATACTCHKLPTSRRWSTTLNCMTSNAAPEKAQYYPIIIIGAGQAGLSAAGTLRRRGLVAGRDFVVLDSNAGPGGAWRHRWQALTLGRAHGIHD